MAVTEEEAAAVGGTRPRRRRYGVTSCFAHKSSCFVCTRPGVYIVILGYIILLVLPTDPLRVTAHV